MNTSVENDIRFDEFLLEFQKIIHEYESRLYGYTYKVFAISKSQYVFLIADSFAIFAYITRSRFFIDDYTFVNRAKKTTSVSELFEIHFEELLYNEVFFFSATKFIKEMHIFCKSVWYTKFNSIVILRRDKDSINFKNSNFYYVNQKLPELHLLEIFDNWKGHLYNYIVYEYELNGQTGYASFYTSLPTASYEAYQKEHVLEEGLIAHYAYPNNSPSSRGNFYHEGMVISPELKNIGIALIESGKSEGWKNIIKKTDKQSFLSGNLKYFIVPIYIKRIDNGITSSLLKEVVIENAKNGKYSNIERCIFNLADYKWTSELLCYQLMKEIFKKNIVLHQYRPFFLKTRRDKCLTTFLFVVKILPLNIKGNNTLNLWKYLEAKKILKNKKNEIN